MLRLAAACPGLVFGAGFLLATLRLLLLVPRLGERTAELLVLLKLRGLSLGEYLRERDPLAGGLDLVSLLLFAAWPALVSPAGPERDSG